MSDRREQILERLRALAKVRGVGTVARNRMTLTDQDALPAVILYDGEEMVTPPPNSFRPALQPYIITMLPWFQITLQGDDATIGESLNALRMKLLAAVLNDAELLALSLDGRSVRPDATITKFAGAQRAAQGDMALRFSIMYALRASDVS